MGVYEQEGLGINHIRPSRLKTLQQSMINYSTERGLRLRLCAVVYTSLPRFYAPARSPRGLYRELKAEQTHGHRSTRIEVRLKKMKIFGRVFIRNDADTFATLSFQASELEGGFERRY